MDEEGETVGTLAKSAPEPGAPVKTTIDPDLQEAAVVALAGRAGGIAVLDARTGDVRALAGQAYSAPQPPGSTFKMVTTTAALQKGVVSLDDEFEIVSGVNVGGRFINNANGELCGGTFRQAFAESCNADFAPLGPQIGNDALVGTAERFGFNSPLTLYAPQLVRAGRPARIDDPDRNRRRSRPRRLGDRPGRSAGDAAGDGERGADDRQRRRARADLDRRRTRSCVPNAKPVRVMSKKIADELTELMVGVVVEGTGTAGAIPQAQVAGKTGTAELGPKAGPGGSQNPVQIKDAWFAAFAPAEKAKLAIGVLLIEAEAAGGEVAAPAAAEVLSTGL